MNQHIFFSQKAYRFRRFKRVGYAAFCSMHRVVNIGRLVTYIADRQLHKSAAVLALFIPLFCSAVHAQTDDELQVKLLPALDVVAAADSVSGSPDAVAVITRQQLQGLPVSSVGELIEQLPGIDLRTRGGGDVQGDLTMRGGTFDQMIILLNGVNLTDAQTGHHNMDIPIDLSMVDRVEIIPAAALSHYGLSSFCGAVNIVTGSAQTDRVNLQISGGSFGQAHLSGGISRQVNSWNVTAAAAYHRSNGYRQNTDYSHGSLYLQAQRKGERGDWSIQFGSQMKDFGSQAFYSTKYPDQFESTRTLMGSVSYLCSWRGWQLESTLYGRLHKDRFELFREGVAEAPAWYPGHNYHLSSSLGARFRASRNWSLGRSIVGAEIRDEGILSTVLGDSLSAPRSILLEPEGLEYTMGKNRLGVNAFAEHSIFLRSARVYGGLLVGYNTLLGGNYGYSLGVECPVAEYWHVGGSFGRSFRLPTYTDLYYHSATQISNPDLKPEESYHAEMNLRFRKNHISSLATLYARHGTNIIDWVRTPESSVWHSVNHAAIDAVGFDLQAAYHGSGWLNRVGASYSFCTLAQQEDGFISNYVLDYLRHKLSADVVLSPVKGLRVKLLADYHLREGSYTDGQGNLQQYAPVWLLNAGVDYSWTHYSVFVDGYNLLNTQYFDYSGIPQAGISFLAGIRLNY